MIGHHWLIEGKGKVERGRFVIPEQNRMIGDLFRVPRFHWPEGGNDTEHHIALGEVRGRGHPKKAPRMVVRAPGFPDGPNKSVDKTLSVRGAPGEDGEVRDKPDPAKIIPWGRFRNPAPRSSACFSMSTAHERHAAAITSPFVEAVVVETQIRF